MRASGTQQATAVAATPADRGQPPGRREASPRQGTADPPLVARLTDQVLDRSSYRREPYSHRLFWRLQGYLDYDFVYLGTHHSTHPRGHIKWVDLPVFPVPPTELGRRYLTNLFELQRPQGSGMAAERVPWRRPALAMLNINQPTFYFGGGPYQSDDLAYVDISAAFWQLYRPATLDLWFVPGPRPGLALGRLAFLDAEELRVSKAVRNFLIGATRTLTRTVGGATVGDHPVTEPLYNRLLAPHLWGYLMYTLHTIAAEVRQRFGAGYISCDGYVVAGEQADGLVQWLWQRWRLQAIVKARGPGEVAAGAWRIGEEGTRNLPKRGGKRTEGILPYNPALGARLRDWRVWMVERPPTLWGTTEELLAAGGQVLRRPSAAPRVLLPAPRVDAVDEQLYQVG